MHDECLLELYQSLTPDARRAFDVVTRLKVCTMERIMTAGLTTQQTRRGVWGLASTGLIVYTPGRPVRISDNGDRLVALLTEKEKSN